MNADDFLLELSAAIYGFRTCIFSSSDVPMSILPFGKLSSPDDFRTFS